MVIVAGYDGLMDEFIHSNPGLESRFNRFLHFADYTAEELLAIFRMQCEKGCYILEPEAEAPLRSLLERRMADAASFGNARGVRNLFEQILVRQAAVWRTGVRQPGGPDADHRRRCGGSGPGK